jgi:hypothetical protein
MIYAVNTVFYKTPESISRLRVNIARDVDLFGVIDSLMLVALRRNTVIAGFARLFSLDFWMDLCYRKLFVYSSLWKVS